jgi:hypothetical protein
MTSFSMLVGNDRIELIAIAEFAGLCLAIDVEWFEPSSHSSSRKNRPRTHGQKPRSPPRLGGTPKYSPLEQVTDFAVEFE